MKKATQTCLISLVALNALFSQLNSSFDCAELLGRKNLAITSYYTRFSYDPDGSFGLSSEHINLVGIKIGIGLNDVLDLQACYSRLSPNVDLVNLIEISPKLLLIKNRLAGLLPLSYYFGKEGKLFSISPKVLFTYPFNNHFDISLSPEAEVTIGGNFETWFELSFGWGISSNLRKWAIRPEFGIILVPNSDDSPIFNYGLGFNYILRK